MNMQAVGGFLRGYRKARRMKAEEVAAEAGERLGRTVDRATIYRIEKGDHSPAADLFMAIVSVLSAPADLVQDIALSGLSAAEGEEAGRRSARGETQRLTEEEKTALNDLPPEQRRRLLDTLLSLIRG